MPAPQVHRDADGRPDFMVVLGVAPPYVEDDVREAYFQKAKFLHPDRGGDPHEFSALHEAFEQAKQYLEFKRDSRGWIAKQMDGYLQSRELADKLVSFGAQVETNAVDWLQRSFGDFADLTEAITAVRLENSNQAERMLNEMVKNAEALAKLVRLELPGCQVSDQGVLRCEVFQQLQHMDLSRTPVTKTALAIVDRLPNLESLELLGSKVWWWSRRRVAAELQRRREEKPAILR
ncbi:J domain-containing protein [Bythopirellula polymerisocia]|uniref:DnaJ domain protein n=1 Tax=Bythopirellula polymerisocia TaxID=2528003 RepID=A0A5C6CJJ5_9BACT|nr:J domain-containing protein [Bythopirellula polymerisocia]TWU24532.1 DnaJ domain protein [Bythopirellula polymerisocia]